MRDELLWIGGISLSLAFDDFVIANDTLETREDPETNMGCVSLLFDSAPIDSAIDGLAFALVADSFGGLEDDVRDLGVVLPPTEPSSIVSSMYTTALEVV